MRISIWQQWSSNHSALYAIVGEFASTEAAEAAATTLHGIADAIRLWFKQPRGARAEAPAFPAGPEGTWAERAAADWTDYLGSTVRLFGYHPPDIVRWDRLVIVSMLEGQSFTHAPEPADHRVFSDLGGRAAVDGEGEGGTDSVAAVHLTCHAVDEGTAETLEQEIRAVLDRETFPWSDDNQPWDPDGKLKADEGEGEGIIEHRGTQLRLHVRFFGSTPDGLAALTRYLTDRGCTALAYSLEQVQPHIWAAWIAAGRFVEPVSVTHSDDPMLLMIMAVAPGPLAALTIMEALRGMTYLPDLTVNLRTHGLAASVDGARLTLDFQTWRGNVAEVSDAVRKYLEEEKCSDIVQVVTRDHTVDMG